MPAAMEYRPDDRMLRDAAEDELRTRREKSAKAWRYYEGNAPKTLKARRDGDDDNVNVNLLRTTVDRIVAFLVPQMPQLELELGGPDTDDEKWLRAWWQAQGGARALARLALYGCLEGHVFAKVLPGSIRLAALNPANVLVWWAADDVDSVLWYEQRWEVGDVRYRQDIVRDGEAWLILDYVAGQTGDWRLRADPARWPYRLPPIVDWQHGVAARVYYGEGEAGNLALNDRVNRTASDMARILRYHASPRTVGTGFSAGEEQETAIGGLWTIANPEAKVYNLEMKGDLAASMNTLEYLTRAYMAERRVVILKGDISDFQRVTNLALRALFLDQIAKNEELRRAYEIGIQGISQRALMLDGRAAWETAPKVIWPDPLPSDPKEAVEVLEKERALGIVSRETAAHERGRDWELEQARIDEEGESMIDRMLREPPEADFGTIGPETGA